MARGKGAKGGEKWGHLYVSVNSKNKEKQNKKKTLRFSLFIFREGKRETKRGKETTMRGCVSHALNRGPGLQPRHVP